MTNKTNVPWYRELSEYLRLLGTRIYNVLYRRGITTFGALKALDDSDLLKFRGFGRVSVYKIRFFLSQFNVR